MLMFCVTCYRESCRRNLGVPSPIDFILLPGLYVNPSTYVVEADATSASYPLAFAAITGGRVSVNIPLPAYSATSLQGESSFITEVLQRMGCSLTVRKMEKPVKGSDFCV